MSVHTVCVSLHVQSCLDANTRPACLSDKTLDSAIKHINKKFPIVDTKVSFSLVNNPILSTIVTLLVSSTSLLSQDRNHLTAISSLQKDIMQHLPNYYHTFVDVMEFRDVTNEVVTSVATSQFIFDIVRIFFV